MTRRWYVVRTNPRSERLAAASLEREGMEHFFPKVRVPEVGGAGREVPLFPGYLFLRLDTESLRWLSVDRLPGILGWVQLGNELPSVPDVVIGELADKVAEINVTGGLWKRFQPGEIVRVVTGKVDSLARVLDGPETPESRVRVLLDFMGREVSAQVSVGDIQPVQENDILHERRKGRRTRGQGRWIKGHGPRAVVAV